MLHFKYLSSMVFGFRQEDFQGFPLYIYDEDAGRGSITIAHPAHHAQMS